MIAVIKTGGKQYLVKLGDIIKVDRINVKLGDSIKIDKILALYKNDKNYTLKLGDPFIKSLTVKAKVIEQTKDKKVIIFKKKRRQNYRRKKGHKQLITILEIKKIEDN